jgi:rhodanese-related sulfurtransferase
MCQVGGRVQPFLTLLAQYNYDMSKVYNIGGWNQIKDLSDFGGYEVALGIGASAIEYDFSALTPVASAAKAAKRSAELPTAWAEGATYQAKECSVSLLPGSLENPNAKAVKEYFTTENVRFFDLRDVKEGYGVGHIQKFESISYFNTIVGDGEQLFKKEGETFVARYEESESMLNKMFPKDATLFVMCQVGGRVQPFLTLLKQYGYDTSKVYNVGGWNNVNSAENYGGYSVSLGVRATSIEYDFSTLTLITNS